MTKRKNRDYIMGRYIFIMVGIILVAIAVAVRLFSTTVIHAAEWEAKAESLNRTRVVEPERGKILADDRTVLAANVNFYVPRLDLRSALPGSGRNRFPMPTLTATPSVACAVSPLATSSLTASFSE